MQWLSGKNLIRKSNAKWFLYILPALLIYTGFMALPLLNSLRLSLFTGTGFALNEYVGFDNYKRLFSDPLVSQRFWGAFGNTWFFFFVHMFVQNILGLLFALILNNRFFRGRELYRTIIFIPTTLAVVITGFLWKLILNPQWGSVNLILEKVGLGDLALPWLGLSETALPVISLVSSWQWVGIPTMIFLAALQQLPAEYFEAAEIDGANSLQVFRHIKFPLLVPIIGVVSILTFTANFNAFDVVFAMAGINGAPEYSSDILGTYFYRVGIAGEHPVGIPNMGMGAAVASVTFIVLFIGVLIFRKLTEAKKLR